MNDAASVRRSECVSNLDRDQERTLQFEWASGDQLSNVSAIDVLHGDEVHAIDLIQIKDGANVGMIQRRRESCLTFKALEISFFGCELRRQHLNYNGPSELRVDG